MVERRIFRRSRVRIPFYFFYYLFSFTRKEKSYERKNDTQEKLTKDPDDTRCDGDGIYGIRNGESHTKSTVTYPGSVNGLTIRQNGKYLYSSSASNSVNPSSFRAAIVGSGCGVNIVATFGNTVNATVNDVCSITASIKITFS